jgi:hypothetical protein
MTTQGGGWELVSSFVREDAHRWNIESPWNDTSVFGNHGNHLSSDYKGAGWTEHFDDVMYKVTGQTDYAVFSSCLDGSSLAEQFSLDWIRNDAADHCVADQPVMISGCWDNLYFKSWDYDVGGVHGKSMLSCGRDPWYGGDAGALGQIEHTHACAAEDYGCHTAAGDFTGLGPVTLWAR